MKSLRIILGLILASPVFFGQSPFINEIHYDNSGGDIDEGVEVIFPAGIDIDCYQIEAYNGGDSTVYNTTAISSTYLEDACGFDAVWTPISGLQNGPAEAIALVFEPTLSGCTTSGSTTVIQFLSYEGTIQANDGSAVGLTSTDIGVSEPATPVGQTLQLTGTGNVYSDFTWTGGIDSTMGAINTGQNLCSGGTPYDVIDESLVPSDQQLTFSWSSPSGCSDEILVVASTSSTFSNTPSGDGTSYVADANFGSGTDLGGGEFVVYKGSGTNFNMLSLTNDTDYCIMIYNRCGTNWSNGVEVCGTPDLFTTTLRVMAYNTLNYPGSTGYRDTSFRKIVHYVDPDIIVMNEMVSAAGLSALLAEVNTQGVSNYAIATFNNGPDSDNALMYKTDILTFSSQTQIATDLRDITDYKLTWPNNSGGTSSFDVFSLHLKAGSLPAEEAQRQLECQYLSTYMDAMAATTNIAVGGDFNFYSHQDLGYIELTANGTQLMEDPIKTPGTWHDNSAFQNIHTQATRSSTNPGGSGGVTGGLDDRFDFLFINDYVRNGRNGVYYNGTYDVIGNDGNKFNVSIIENLPNNDVPDTIRDALFQMSDHLPVMLEVLIDYVDPAALPVELISQEVHRMDLNNVEVSWITATEANTSHFEIYRSVDAIHFESIGTMPANGNSSNQIAYKFIDEKPYYTKTYYDIVEVDFDGNSEKFDLMHVEEIESLPEVVIYPNPSNQNKLNVRGKNIPRGNYFISIFDIAGKQIYQAEFGNDSQNFDRLIALPNLPKNVYTVTVHNEALFFTEKWVKL